MAAWRSLRASHGIRLREVACVGKPRTLLLAEVGDHRLPAVTVAAGVHGDEPAAPWALYAIVRDGMLDSRFSYRVWPCTNPSGAVAGTRENAEGDDINRSFSRGGTTPESKAIITANRDLKFRLAIDLHEDFESDGYYVYESRNDPLALGAHIVSALDDAGLPVQTFRDGFDIAIPPEAAEVTTIERGRVRIDYERERTHFPGWPYSLYITRRAAPRALTCESPRRLPWAERIAAHRVAVAAALGVQASEAVDASN